MKLYEHEALESIYKKFQIPSPKFVFGTEPNEKVREFIEKQPAVVIKSMVLVGKRGKAGAVKVVTDKAKAVEVFKDLATRDVYGEKSVGAIVCEKLDIQKEYYLSVTYSTKERATAITFSEHGGMEVEEIDHKLIHTYIVDDVRSVYPYQIRKFLVGIGFSDPEMLRPLSQREQDAILIDQGDHRGKAGSYVELDGDVALMTFGGGGSTVTAETAIEAGLRVANLTDIGGNPPAEKMYKIARIILSKPGLKAVLVCGGTASNTRIDVTLGEGLAKALDDMNAEGVLNKDLIWVVRRSGPEYVKGLKMLHECFVRNGIKGDIYDSQLPITEAPLRLKELLIKHVNYQPEQIV